MAERRLSLDGVRGVAIVLVMLIHHNVMNSGWAGVDLFFVLSGYLITSILRRTRDDDHYWQEFWIKRATRILPPFLITVTIAAALDRRIFTLVPMYLLSFGDVAAYWHQNLERTTSLWSLAVEEHFYMLWPFAVRSLNRSSLRFILLAIIIMEPLLRAAAVMVRPDWGLVYFLTPFRLDGLSLGALLAIELEAPETADLLRKFSLWGMAATACMYAALRFILKVRFTRGADPTYNALAYSLVAGVSFFLIAHLLTMPESYIGRLLSWRPLVFVGTISYGLYLYQILVLDLCRHFTGLSSRQVFPLSALLCVTISHLSFRFYEKPLILYGKRLAERWRTGAAKAVSVPTAP